MSRRRKTGATPAREWTPFVRCRESVNRVTGERQRVPDDVELWGNNLYNVIIRPMTPAALAGERRFALPPPDAALFVWLSISRRDRKTIMDFRHFQRIKNELVGEEAEGLQLFPAESRLVDTSNQFHLFVCKTPGYRLPFGYLDREVATPEDLAADPTSTGAVQRPFE